MFVHTHRLDFADTRSVLAEPLFGADPLEQMAQTDAADSALLRLVLCVSGATLLLALAGYLAGA